MKSPMRLFAATLILLVPAWALAQVAPYLVHASDTPPGHTLVLTGGDFDPATVQVLVHIPGTEEKQRPDLPKLITDLAQRYPGKAAPLPLTPPAFHTFTLKPFHATGRTVFVELPRWSGGVTYPPGFTCLVWLKQGDRLSNAMAVNRPAAWFLLKNISRPGEMNRINGWNFKGDIYMQNYLFLRPAAGGVARELPQEARHDADGVSEHFCLQFRVPADLAPGDYQVFMHNNSGDIYGFTETLPLKVVKEPDFPQVFFSAVEAGVKGDSFTDDLPALQALVDKVGQAGGGIIYLPPGSYRLNETLQLRANVILRGAGRENTTIFFGGDPAIKTKAYWFISSRDVNHTGIEDLTLRVAPPMTMSVSYYNAGNPAYDCHLTRLRLQGGNLSIHYAVNFEIGDCLFDCAILHISNMDHTWIHDNEFTTGRLRGSPVGIWSSEDSTFEHNRAFGSNRGFVWQPHGVSGVVHSFIDANVVEADRFGGNAGETFLFEGAGFAWLGKPATVQAQGFTATGTAWKPGELKRHYAVVVAGRGLGQYARIADNTADRVTLEQPWTVPPGGDVRLSVMKGVVENAICNNRDVDCDNSMMFYGAGIINNRIVRNRSDNSLGISVWSDGDTAEGRLTPDYFNVFDGNVLEDQGSFWMTVLGDIKQEVGMRNMNNIFRKNFLNDVRRKRENQYGNVWEETRHGMYRPIQAAFWLDIGRSYSQDRTQGPVWVDTLIERNYVTRCDYGVELRNISGGTVVSRNTFFDVKLPLIDQGSGDKLLNNRIEKPILENPPPWAGLDQGK
ncbi:MAG: glycosyl hydrolase family 28-related protein [Kiritimatiellota bacterium]|nr:glycosyl hydrolase family 28-related protein [Kiritimatiellota bacterium]